MLVQLKFFITCVFFISLAPVTHAKTLKVVTTFTIFADITKQIAGDKAEVLSITKVGAEIHNYQPTPKDIIKVKGADLILSHGMNLELWFDKFYRNVKKVPRASLTQGITPLSIHGGEYNGKPNPHAWMSANNAYIYIDNISRALSKAAPEHAQLFNDNAEQYKAKIEKITTPFKAQIAALAENKRWLVSSEGAFSYLARDLDLKELFIWPINADAQGTPQQMRRVIDLINAHDITAVFSESTVSDKPARQIARESSASYGGVLYVDSLSLDDGPVPSYIQLLSVTMQTIVNALTKNNVTGGDSQ
ncbi:metal ABC transporter substrate-binding protein [Gammaproteobacteria bacterium AS21]